MSKLENNIIINLDGYALELTETENFTVRNCVFYGDAPRFWGAPLEWLAIKILLWKHRNLRGTPETAIYVHTSEKEMRE